MLPALLGKENEGIDFRASPAIDQDNQDQESKNERVIRVGKTGPARVHFIHTLEAALRNGSRFRFPARSHAPSKAPQGDPE